MKLKFLMLEVISACALAVSGSDDPDADAVDDDVPSGIPVLVQTVQIDKARVVRRFPARVRAIEQVEVVSRLSADIVEIGFVEGSRVKKGQLLYHLDEVRFAAAVSNQLARVSEIRAKLELASLTCARKKSLLAKEMCPRADFDAALSARRELEAALEAAKAEFALAADDLKHARILSPIDGRIGLTTKTVGNYVTPESGTLATIVSTDPLRVRFSLPMADYARFFACDEARLKREAEIHIAPAPGLPEQKAAVVEFVDTKAVERTDTVLVYVRQPNPEGRLVPDSAVTLMMFIEAHGTLPWVPPQAVMEEDDHTCVYVVEGARAVLREVSIRDRLRDRFYVTRGLVGGETLIVGGGHKVSEGDHVSCQEAR